MVVVCGAEGTSRAWPRLLAPQPLTLAPSARGTIAILTDKFLRTQVIGGMLFSKKHPDAHGVLRYVENVEYVNT